MRDAVRALLAALPEERRHEVARPFDDPRRRWMDYRPRPRPGLTLGALGPAGRKLAHRLLATALRPPAYAQAMAVVALEEVLDRAEGWARGRHSDDYAVVVFGDPDGDAPWSWRFEGHHLSLTMTLDGDTVAPAPLFLGANPARTDLAGHPVLRPFAPEEELAFALLSAMGPAGRAEAIVSDTAPDDVHSGPFPGPDPGPLPRGVAASRLDRPARELFDRLRDVYLDRLPPDLADAERQRLDGDDPAFAWEGAPRPGVGHYYRITGRDLLIEYDNRDNDANHAHTVLRRPDGEFGADLIAAHRARDPH
ncbi:hypothetical protein Val02_19130 [Virgisporangium aliadipatigenens]|uniref:DUF3500 domain-containing protein n=2 Tax=Virgisporangium aliadipatigenens TaxID=741659 RepID=A0A8J4DQ39_9ACTN|nr:hypothetical protein Val02_19130 [Virgisporangium aliadipatigenens]